MCQKQGSTHEVPIELAEGEEHTMAMPIDAKPAFPSEGWWVRHDTIVQNAILAVRRSRRTFDY